MIRHIRSLRNQEIQHMSGAAAKSKAHQLHEKNVAYLERYEKILEHQGGSILKKEQREIEHHSNSRNKELTHLQAAIKPIEKDMGRVRKMMSKLEGEKAAIEKQLAVVGAYDKGDKAPVKFFDKITNKGRTKHLAKLDDGNTRSGFMRMFKPSEKLDKLSKADLQAKLTRVEEQIGEASGKMKEFEARKMELVGGPMGSAPTHDVIDLPSREQVLTMMHKSQPLRKTPWVDPLTDLGQRGPNSLEGNPKISRPIAGRPIPAGAENGKVPSNAPLTRDEMRSAVKASKLEAPLQPAMKPYGRGPDGASHIDGPWPDPGGKKVRFAEQGNPLISSPSLRIPIPADAEGIPSNPMPPRHEPASVRPPARNNLARNIPRSLEEENMRRDLRQGGLQGFGAAPVGQPIGQGYRGVPPQPRTPQQRLEDSRRQAVMDGVIRQPAQSPLQAATGNATTARPGGQSIAGSSSRPYQGSSWTQLDAMRSNARADLQAVQARHAQNPTHESANLLQTIQGHVQALDQEARTRDRNDEIHHA